MTLDMKMKLNAIKEEYDATQQVLKNLEEEYNAYLDTGREEDYYVKVLENKISRENGYLTALFWAFEVLKK